MPISQNFANIFEPTFDISIISLRSLKNSLHKMIHIYISNIICCKPDIIGQSNIKLKFFFFLHHINKQYVSKLAFIYIPSKIKCTFHNFTFLHTHDTFVIVVFGAIVSAKTVGIDPRTTTHHPPLIANFIYVLISFAGGLLQPNTPARSGFVNSGLSQRPGGWDDTICNQTTF